MCNCARLHPVDTNCKNASHSNTGAGSRNSPRRPSLHPQGRDEMMPASGACPTNPISLSLRTDQCTDETSDHIPPKSEPLLPGSNDSHSIQNKPPQIASSGSPVASCLLYTSDAADDLLCVDLGGRRVIKKKKAR